MFEDYILVLLNEMICSWMVTSFNAVGECDSVEALIAALFPRRTEDKTVDKHMAAVIRDTVADSVLFPGFDHTALCNTIRGFLDRYCAASPVRTLLSPLQVAAMMKYLLDELLQQMRSAVPGVRQVIVPLDVRIALNVDGELFNLLSRSEAYWSREILSSILSVE